MMLLLIKRGATVDKGDWKRATPLWSAAEKNKPEAAAILLEHGAAVDARNSKGETPLWTACARGNVPAARAPRPSGTLCPSVRALHLAFKKNDTKHHRKRSSSLEARSRRSPAARG